MANVTLEGMDGLVAKVQEMGQKAVIVENQALKKGAAVLQKSASQKAPRSAEPREPKPPTQEWRTGEHLADNIVVTRVKKKGDVKFVEVGPTPGDNSPFFYGKFLEYGTSKMPAQPFMGPAEAESKRDIMETMKDTLREGLGL